MFIRKRCPKCSGNVYIDKDYQCGWYEKCLQCGCTRYFDMLFMVEEQINAIYNFDKLRNDNVDMVHH